MMSNLMYTDPAYSQVKLNSNSSSAVSIDSGQQKFNGIFEDSTQQKFQELADLMKRLRSAKLENFRNAFCINALKKCSTESTLSEAEDVRNKIIMHDIQRCLPLKSANKGLLEEHSLLGLENNYEIKISYEGTVQLKKEISETLKNEHKEIFAKLRSNSKRNPITAIRTEDVVKFSEFNSPTAELERNLQVEMEKYLQLNLNLATTFDRVLTLKETNMNKLNGLLLELQARFDTCIVKNKLFGLKLQSMIFKENNEMEIAVGIASQDLYKDRSNIETDVSRMEKDLEIFRNMDPSGELATLVRKHTDYTNSLRLKMKIYGSRQT